LSELKKIYTDDPLIKYATSTIKAERSKQQIDGILAEYGTKDVLWHYDIPRSAYVYFKIEEEIDGKTMSIGVKVDCPTIWNKAKPRGHPPRPEEINWDVSMRAMYHFIYTHLNAAYAMQSGKIVAFLAYVAGTGNKQLKDYILPRLGEYAALEHKESPESETVSGDLDKQSKIVDVEYKCLEVTKKTETTTTDETPEDTNGESEFKE
jgi:hypothetical protein